MDKEHNHMKASLKREITQMYRHRNGKGPESIDINIFGELVCIKFTGAFTPIEKSLMKSDTGKEIAVNLRKEMSYSHSAYYYPIIEEIVQIKIKDSSYMLDEVKDDIYIFVLFEEPIPE